jgi:hypothetical protein
LPVATAAIVAIAASLMGCSPTFDWREFTPEASGIVARFPCRPDRQARAVEIAGQRLPMTMFACAAGGAQFAVSYVDAADAGRVGAAMNGLRMALVSNVAAESAPAVQALRVPGMTPAPEAARLMLTGHLPDGSPLLLHAGFFSKGLRIYQVAVTGQKPVADEAVESFFAGLRF